MISVVITTYETWEATAKCVCSLLQLSEASIDDIVIVDDASLSQCNLVTDRVRVIRNPINKGYVRSVNIGVRATKTPFVLLMDSDAYPLVDILSETARTFASDPSLGIIGFRLVDGTGARTGSTTPDPTVMGFILGQRLAGAIDRRSATVSHIHSCAIALRREAFDSVGGFDEDFDFLDADIDFSMRVLDRGWRSVTRNDLTVYHVGAGSPQSTERRVLRFHKNRLMLLTKHRRIPCVQCVQTALFLRHLVELLTLGLVWLVPSKRGWALRKIRGRQQLLMTVFRSYEAANI